MPPRALTWPAGLRRKHLRAARAWQLIACPPSASGAVGLNSSSHTARPPRGTQPRSGRTRRRGWPPSAQAKSKLTVEELTRCSARTARSLMITWVGRSGRGAKGLNPVPAQRATLNVLCAGPLPTPARRRARLPEVERVVALWRELHQPPVARLQRQRVAKRVALALHVERQRRRLAAHARGRVVVDGALGGGRKRRDQVQLLCACLCLCVGGAVCDFASGCVHLVHAQALPPQLHGGAVPPRPRAACARR